MSKKYPSLVSDTKNFYEHRLIRPETSPEHQPSRKPTQKNREPKSQPLEEAKKEIDTTPEIVES